MTTHQNARKVLLNKMKALDLLDIWRTLNLDKSEFTW